MLFAKGMKELKSSKAETKSAFYSGSKQQMFFVSLTEPVSAKQSGELTQLLGQFDGKNKLVSFSIYCKVCFNLKNVDNCLSFPLFQVQRQLLAFIKTKFLDDDWELGF